MIAYIKALWAWVVSFFTSKIEETIPVAQAGRVAPAGSGTKILPLDEAASSLRGMARAAFYLDKGLATAPSHLTRRERVEWVYRSKPARYWR